MVTTAVDDLHGAHLRITRPRIAVLTEVYAHPHADVETIAAAARARLGSVSTQAVYDVLRVLTDVGLVRHIQPAGSVARFEARVGDNHHHLVCRHCGAIEDVDCATDQTPCLEPSDHRGFTVDEAEVTYWGSCSSCNQFDDIPTDSSTIDGRHT
jgi:Fur family transcriptional regulator, stress-responsive regulator